MSKYQYITPDHKDAIRMQALLIKQGAKAEIRESTLIKIHRQVVVPDKDGIRTPELVVDTEPVLTEYTHQLDRELDEDEIADEQGAYWVVEADKVPEGSK